MCYYSLDSIIIYSNVASHSWHWYLLSSTCLLFWSLWLEVYQFYGSSQRTSFWFHLFSSPQLLPLSLFSISLVYLLTFIISFLLLILVLIYSPFYSFLRWKLRSLVWDISPFLVKAFNAIKFSLNPALAAFCKFSYVRSFSVNSK